ncbi:MAG: molybdopterin molybdotransferase MoeA [Bacillota bacterium]
MLGKIELEEGQQILLKRINPLQQESVPTIDALDRVAYQDLYANHDLPPYHQSAVDGYAVHGGEEEGMLRLLKPQSTKTIQSMVLKSGEAVAVFTGGPIPEGTEGVILQEHVEKTEEGIAFSGEIVPGSNIKLPGEDIRHGELLIPKGTCLTPGHIGLLAAFGYQEIPVFGRPRVAVLSIGTQIVSHNMVPVAGETRDSNGPLLASFVKQEGGQVVALEVISGYKIDDLKEKLLKLFQEVDLVIITGGTYAGTRGEARLLLRELGAQMLCEEVPLKPGGHNAAALWENTPIISLSGNPSASLVGFELLAMPVIRALQGINPYPKRISAICVNTFIKKRSFRYFVRGYVECTEEGWTVEILPGQKPSMMRPFIKCNALIDLPPGDDPVNEGDKVSVILIGSILKV